jgi:undecaprenyl-diphosphatase
MALLVVCVALTVFLAEWYTHQTRAGWLDTAIDIRVQSLLGRHPAVASLVRLGGPIPVTTMTALLVIVCLATRRRRAAVLVVIAVSGAEAVTELLLKPLVRRTLAGELSFPSGHTTGVFALAVAFAILLVDPPRPRMPTYLRVLLALAALLAASIVAVAIVDMH